MMRRAIGAFLLLAGAGCHGTPSTPTTPTQPTGQPPLNTSISVGVTASTSSPFTHEPVTFTAIVSDNGVPFSPATIAWDFTGDSVADRLGNPATWTFSAAGTQHAAVIVTATDGRRGEGRLEVVVDPPDTVTVSLASTPSMPTVGQAVIFTATITSRTGVLPDGLTIEWDFDGDGGADPVTLVNTAAPEAPTSYDSAGQWTARVTVRGTDGRRAVTATRTINVSR